MLGNASGLHSDASIVPEVDNFCEMCKMSTICQANCGHELEDRRTNGPGQIFYLDLTPNMAKTSSSRSNYYPDCLAIACACSRFFNMGNVDNALACQAMQALQTFFANNPPFHGYSPRDNCYEIHAGAGSIFTSEEFLQFCKGENVKLVIAAPEHQEMSGLPERMWQSARLIAFSQNNNARLGFECFHHSLKHATRAMSALPVKGCLAPGGMQ